MPKIIWEKQPYTKYSESAFSGKLYVGEIGTLGDGKPGKYWFHVKYYSSIYNTKIHGEVKTKISAKRAIQRAWDKFCALAELS